MEDNEPEKKLKKQGGLKTMPFILGNEICDKFATAGFNANMVSYLTSQFHLSLVEALNTLSNFSGTTSLISIAGALISNSFAGRFWTIAFGSMIYQLALVEAAEERQKENSSVNGSNGSRSFEDFENDPIAEVFGKEKRKNYCRAISSTSTMKQVKLTQASKAIANFKEDEDRKWKAKMENNQNRLTEEFRSMHSTMMSMQQSLLQFMNQFGGNATPRNEVASNSQHDSPRASLGVQSNGAIRSSTRDRQSVVLLSEELKEVAKGHFETRKICHHREVMNGEKVVWVEKVFDAEAPIYEAPQNGNYKLFDIIDGGFVIWPECRVRCL